MRIKILVPLLAVVICFTAHASGEELAEQKEVTFETVKEELHKRIVEDGKIAAAVRGMDSSCGVTSLAMSGFMFDGVTNSNFPGMLSFVLENCTENLSTFEVSCAAMALCQAKRRLPVLSAKRAKEIKKVCEKQAKRLIDAQDSKGVWGYTLNDDEECKGDLSILLLTVSALNELALSEMKIKPEVWEKTLQFLVETQHNDGGWGYTPETPSSISMTASGLTCALICHRRMRLSNRKKQVPAPEFVTKAVECLDKQTLFTVNDRMPFFALYAFCQLTAVSGLDHFSEMVYDAGARMLSGVELSKLEPQDLAFALYFMGFFTKSPVLHKLIINKNHISSEPYEIISASEKVKFNRMPRWRAVRADKPLRVLPHDVVVLSHDRSYELSAPLRRIMENSSSVRLLAYPSGEGEDFALSIMQGITSEFPEYIESKVDHKHALFSVPNDVRARKNFEIITYSEKTRGMVRVILVNSKSFAQKVAMGDADALQLYENILEFLFPGKRG